MPVGAWLNVKKAVDWGSSMSLTKREGVNLEKVERRLKIDVKRDANSNFCHHQERFVQAADYCVICGSLRCLIKLGAAAVSSFSFLPWLLMLLEDIYSDYFMSTHCSPFWSLAQKIMCLMFWSVKKFSKVHNLYPGPCKEQKHHSVCYAQAGGV